MRIAILAGAAAFLSVQGASATTIAASGNAAAGAKLFQQRCVNCHTLKSGASGVGPALQGVVGRRAATGKFTRYTPALKKANITFTQAELDRFLAAPQKAAPGTTMMIATPKAQDRADIIAYLTTLKK